MFTVKAALHMIVTDLRSQGISIRKIPNGRPKLRLYVVAIANILRDKDKGTHLSNDKWIQAQRYIQEYALNNYPLACSMDNQINVPRTLPIILHKRPKIREVVDVDPTTNAFLESPAWRKLRYKILIRDNHTCLCCGRTPKDGIILNVDHIKPRKKFPGLALALSNLQTLCEDCNAGKGNWDETDWRTK